MTRPNVATYTVARRITATKTSKGALPRRHLLWRAIRILRTFTASDLMAVAEQKNRASVMAYLSLLRRGGYLRVHYGNSGRHEPARFVLIRNTGTEAPAVTRKGRAIYDFNLHEEVPLVTE